MPAPLHPSPTLRDCVYGQAVGDALGVPYEFRARGTFGCTGMVGHGSHSQPPGTWSDDTSMALANCGSIRATGRGRSGERDNGNGSLIRILPWPSPKRRTTRFAPSPPSRTRTPPPARRAFAWCAWPAGSSPASRTAWKASRASGSTRFSARRPSTRACSRVRVLGGGAARCSRNCLATNLAHRLLSDVLSLLSDVDLIARIAARCLGGTEA